MTLPSPADREARPGGRWSTPELLLDLLRLASLERAVAHVIAAWVPKIPDLDEKLGIASSFEDSMVRATALRQHALTLLERDESGLTVDPVCIAPLLKLDRRANRSEVVSALLVEVPAFLLNRYRALVLQLDALLDARLITTVHTAISRLESNAFFRNIPRHADVCRGPLAIALDAAWKAKSTLRVPLDDALWPPTDRVPVPARPEGRERPVAGVRGHFRKGSRLTIEDLAGELNDNVMAELCALELLCRSSYEHPKQPWSVHLAMARHATDEARHAAIFRRLLEANGIDESMLPQHGANYEYSYEFPECEPGGQRELLWRLLILCTVLEALAIDKLPVEIGGRDFVGQVDFARALDYIAADELYHTENGLRLTRRLCDQLNLDPMLERERVHGRFFGRQRDVRTEYLEADPVRAASEIAFLEAPDPDGVPFDSRTEVELRLRASFSIEECEQVERWQYNPVRHELFSNKTSLASPAPLKSRVRRKGAPLVNSKIT
jgi:uncharacterized ferritin-like protein (DUF455 family)